MAKLIDADKRIAEIKKIYCDGCDNRCGVKCLDCWVDDAMCLIDDAPSADAVEVVRCRKCMHWKPSGSKAGNSFSDMEYIGGCEFTNYSRRESDFCSYGERKDGDGNG